VKSAVPLSLAEAAFDRHQELYPPLTHYTGIVSLHALTRLAVIDGGDRLREKAREALLPFVRGERMFRCNFANYQGGGLGTAYLLWQGHLPEAADTVRHYAEEIMHQAPRDASGILCHPKDPPAELIWIDVAFAVTPFLLFAGLALEEEAYVEQAFRQTAGMLEAFHNPETGLYHQSLNFRGPGLLTEDHWSRGNGWGAYALTELAVYLPEDHPRRPEALRLYRDHVAACARYQDPDGLWHQEMTEPLSYVETSGSALMLYAIGAGLAAGLLDAGERERFERGLSGLLPYITDELDIHHTSIGCLCPGKGTRLDYMARRPAMNDPHAFGPVALAFGQAAALGISRIERSSK